MAVVTEIKGFAEVMSNLNRKIGEIEGGTTRGLILGAALVLRDTELTPPLTPVDTGNMRASRFVVTAKGVPQGTVRSDAHFKGKNAGTMMSNHRAMIAEMKGVVTSMEIVRKKVVALGYSANYAFFVHENIGMHDPNNPYWVNRKHKWRPDSGAKWLEASFKRNSPKIVEIIKSNAKI